MSSPVKSAANTYRHAGLADTGQSGQHGKVDIMGASDWAFGRDTPIAQLALRGACKTTVERWFSEDGLRFTSAETDAYGLPSPPAPIGSDPIVLQLASGALASSPGRVLDALAELAERAPIVAILDAEMADVLPPFLDVEPAEYVAWPCGKEAFMSALQQMGSPLLRERTEQADINPLALRVEVERIAKALAALVEGSTGDKRVPTDVGAAEGARIIRGIIRRRRARSQFFPPSCSPIRPGTSCSTSPRRGSKTHAFRFQAFASPPPCRRRLRSGGSRR